MNHEDRTPTRPGRRLITPEASGAPYYVTVDFADEPVTEGAVVNKAMLDEFLAASGTTTGSESALALTQAGFVLVDGAKVRYKTHLQTAASATLNVSGTGARSIVAATGGAFPAVSAGMWVEAVYSSTANAYVVSSSVGDSAAALAEAQRRLRLVVQATPPAADPTVLWVKP